MLQEKEGSLNSVSMREFCFATWSKTELLLLITFCTPSHITFSEEIKISFLVCIFPYMHQQLGIRLSRDSNHAYFSPKTLFYSYHLNLKTDILIILLDSDSTSEKYYFSV